ncbi:MAG: N-6 DNA methylase [Firmicutes bacterium]|nr:N-6 DNA methylase [Bacillota bacterium]
MKDWNEYIEKCYAGIENIDDLGDLYERELANDKDSKKKSGQYYTPYDVACLMSEWLAPLEGDNICDVCCGTGNLIMAYFDVIGKDETLKLLSEGRVFLYDNDPTAMSLCVNAIGVKYGKEYVSKINACVGDFLDKECNLPEKAKVISNPPYFKITDIPNNWIVTDVIKDSKDFYSAIMEKILDQSTSSVIITPYSFIGGNKFYSLRQKMNNHEGFIVSFDNVPGNIFAGRKYGVFNSNTSNSVRAAITVSSKGNKGYRCSPLIRFKNEERKDLLNKAVLEGTLSDYQKVSDEEAAFAKCNDILLLNKWKSSGKKLKDLLVDNSEYKLCIPNSCRYFTVSTKKDLDRTGKYTLCFKSESDLKLAYGLINSSFAYWWWRIYDGGITYPLSLLLDIPLIYADVEAIVDEMIEAEEQCLVYKKNAGKMQENVKFSDKYRKQLNKVFLDELNYKTDILNQIHNNHFFNR